MISSANDRSPVALTRAVSPAIVRCELTHLQRTPIDVDRARTQHEAYEHALVSLGCRVERLPMEADLPDSVFVEDTAVVVDELAVITRPGAPSRRAETASTKAALSRLRPVVEIDEPGTLDGGDVLRVGRRLWVGATSRSDPAGIAALREALAGHGYSVEPTPVGGCLHLKTAVSQVAEDTVLLNPAWVDRAAFSPLRCLEVDVREPYAANALLVGDAVVFPSAYPRTAEVLVKAGVRLVPVDVSELAKAEAGVTCCSIIVRT